MVLDNHRMSFVINTGIWLVSLDCLNILMVMKSAPENVTADVLGHEHLLSLNRLEGTACDMPHNY